MVLSYPTRRYSDLGQRAGHVAPLHRVPALGGGGDGAVAPHLHERRQLVEPESLDDGPVGVGEGEHLVSPRSEELSGLVGGAGHHEREIGRATRTARVRYV